MYSRCFGREELCPSGFLHFRILDLWIWVLGDCILGGFLYLRVFGLEVFGT